MFLNSELESSFLTLVGGVVVVVELGNVEEAGVLLRVEVDDAAARLGSSFAVLMVSANKSLKILASINPYTSEDGWMCLINQL